MNLAELATKVTNLQVNHSILIYGDPKTGKTRLVGTAAKLPEVKRIFWFDGENGYETLMKMGLTTEEMKKINLFRIPDTREVPRFIETTLKAFTSKTVNNICDAHGKLDCQICAKSGSSESQFLLSDCTHDDLVVVDSGSQLGESAMSLAMLGNPVTAKPEYEQYAAQGKYLSDILGVMQACRNTNFVMITHSIAIEEEMNGVKKDKYFPLIGTRAFSQKCAKYFGTVVYADRKLGKHVAGSSSVYSPNVITGSRLNVQIEKAAELSMKAILIEGGILK